jgi:hypothetical protein
VLPLAPAVGSHHRVEAGRLAVLPFEFDIGLVGRPAEVPAVDDQALLAALHAQQDFGQRCVWGIFDRGPDAAMGRVDPGRHLHINQAVQVEDKIGELVVR